MRNLSKKALAVMLAASMLLSAPMTACSRRRKYAKAGSCLCKPEP